MSLSCFYLTYRIVLIHAVTKNNGHALYKEK